MRRVGFHSGELFAKRVKSGGKYLVEGKLVGNANNDKLKRTDYDQTKSDFDATLISGGSSAPTFNALMAGGSPQSIPCYNFPVDYASYLGFTFVAPLSLPDKAKCVLKVYWTSCLSGVVAGFTSGVVWDIDYCSTSVLISGAESRGRNYNLSGSFSTVSAGNTTFTDLYNVYKKNWAVSGVVCIAPLEIPAGDIAAGDYVKVVLYRDALESADNLNCDASLIGVLIEYID